MILLKFGGKSLANGNGIDNTISIITSKIKSNKKVTIILSARGKTTDNLEFFLEYAKLKKDFSLQWQQFKQYQIAPCLDVDLNKEFELLENIFNEITLTESYTPKIKDLVLAQGEILATKLVSKILNNNGIDSIAIDSRLFLKTDSTFGNAKILEVISANKTIAFFNTLCKDKLPIVTGFIASNMDNDTTTLGRNGSNYSTSIIANYLNAKEIHSYTHIDGIYTANPDKVSSAKIMEHLTFSEANELANFGASILHPKTISPLTKKEIPLRILNTFNSNNNGTTISNNNLTNNIKSVTIQENSSLVHIKGRDLLSYGEIDMRIFNLLNSLQINVGIISQSSSETNISFLIPKTHTNRVIIALKNEFLVEFSNNNITSIVAQNNISLITIIGQNVNNFAPIFKQLNASKIHILSIHNNFNRNNISLIVKSNTANKAANIIHSQIFSSYKKNVFIRNRKIFPWNLNASKNSIYRK